VKQIEDRDLAAGRGYGCFATRHGGAGLAFAAALLDLLVRDRGLGSVDKAIGSGSGEVLDLETDGGIGFAASLALGGASGVLSGGESKLRGIGPHGARKGLGKRQRFGVGK
jgi:hypothetical protein